MTARAARKAAAKVGSRARGVSWPVVRRYRAVAARRMETSERKTAAAAVRQAMDCLRRGRAVRGEEGSGRRKAEAKVAVDDG